MTLRGGPPSWCLLALFASAGCQFGFEEISAIALADGGSSGLDGGASGAVFAGSAGRSGSGASGGGTTNGGTTNGGTTNGGMANGGMANGGMTNEGGMTDEGGMANEAGAANEGGVANDGGATSAGSTSAGAGNGSGGSGGGASAGAGGSPSAGGAGDAGSGVSGSAGGITSSGGSAGAGGVAASGGSSGSMSGVSGASGAASGGSAGAPSLPNCETKYFTSKPYLLCSAELSWDAAKNSCASVGMNLARVDDDAESVWLHDNVYDIPPASAGMWIGARESLLEGTWEWTDGTLFWLGGLLGFAQGGLYTNWSAGEPSGLLEDCGAIALGTGTTGRWFSAQCLLETNVYACESP